MSESNLDPSIKGIECKHVCYTTARDRSANDLLVIKENIHYHDGRIVPNLRFMPNFKRPFYIDRAAFAQEGSQGTYKDKKEWQDLSKLQRFTTTQVGMPDAIYKALNPGRSPSRFMRLREVCRSPYVYGADITTPTLVKHHYMERFPNVNGANGTPLSVCNLDTETDMNWGTGEILMASIAMGPKVHLFVQEKFLAKKCRKPVEEIRQAFDLYLGTYKTKRGIDLVIEICKDAADVVLRAMRRIHEWKPDIVAIWNMNFDIPKMMKELEKAGHDLGEVFSDPAVPEFFRNFRYREGASQKVTQSGKTMPINNFDQWHSVEAPASYQVIDAMCLYRKLRFSAGMENGYSLDKVLDRNLGIRKLTFKEADHVTKGQWHAFMQREYPVEYCVYNCFDTISMQELEEKTGDISKQLGLHAGHSEFSVFPSQPRRTWDDMHFECEATGRVAATTSDKMRVDFDELTADLKGWIVTLPSHQVKDTGLKLLEEMPNYPTMIWAHVADLDITGTYPTTEGLMNISKETTSCEIIKVEGTDDRTQRSIGINLTGGHVNAVEICTRVLKAPTFDVLLADYLEKKGIAVEVVDLGWVEDGSGDVVDEDEDEGIEVFA